MTEPGMLAIAGGPPVRNEFLPFHRPSFGPEEEAEVVAALRSGWVTMGPRSQRLEAAFREMLGVPYALAVSSCTAALHLALLGLGIGPGDEVVTTPLSFATTANVLVHVGAHPVFADVEPDTLNLDPEAAAARITPKTKAIMPVHLHGHPCDMDAFRNLADRHGLLLIEDAAHAIEATYRGRKIGADTAAAAFSFYATKNITTGEGGMLVTSRADLAERAEVLRLHGMSRDAWKRYGSEGFRHWDILLPGYKYNLSDVLAAIGLAQLPKLERFWAERRRIFAAYDAALADVPEIIRPVVRPEVRSAYHLYNIRVKVEELNWTRDQIMAAIQAENIGLGVHFRALHLHPYYHDQCGFRRGLCPVAEAASDRLFSIPLYPGLTHASIGDVVSAIRKVIGVARTHPFPVTVGSRGQA
ncbi:MAG TPA: DegT/DnrJ/EryC1/StrS aminotransferase family protein [Candidatus Methylomirabilis sp.]|nr:DegT/DnrJ/EryC1/StrS aminotransferase family protein [Candidatus Methylomirabilis sp.]